MDEDEYFESPSPRRSGKLKQWVRKGFVFLLVLGGLVLLARQTFTDADSSWRQANVANWRVGTIPALRGRILDRDGFPLAWSSRHFDLLYQVPLDRGAAWEEFQAIRRHVAVNEEMAWRRIQQNGGQTVTIKPDLGPDEIGRLAPFLIDNAGLRVQCRFQRHYEDRGGELRTVIGGTQQFGLREAGIRGWELEHNRRLTGVDGKYRVLLSSNGRWVPGTWEELKAPEPGQDIYMPFTVRREDVSRQGTP